MAIMDAQAMDFADNSFDAVLAALCRFDGAGSARFGAELLRVCRPGGSIVIVIISPRGPG